MRCVRILLVALLSLVASRSGMAAAPMTVMTFNIRYDSGNAQKSDRDDAWLSNSGDHRRDLVFQAISEANPDILCVQEALVNQVADLKQELTEFDFHGVGRDDGDEAGEYCGIFFRRDRFTQTKKGNFWLNEDSETAGTKFPETCCARIATWVVLKDKANTGREFLLLNTHWDHQIQQAREFSATLIERKLAMLGAGRPLVVAGDLNATPDNPAFRRVLGSPFQEKTRLFDCYREAHPEPDPQEATFHGFRGTVEGSRIDYVLRNRAFHTISASILRTHEGDRYPSDHYPVVATLELKE